MAWTNALYNGAITAVDAMGKPKCFWTYTHGTSNLGIHSALPDNLEAIGQWRTQRGMVLL